MNTIQIMGDTKECPEGFDYVLTCLGRKPDEEDVTLHKPLRKGDRLTFTWDNVTDVEIDRFKMLCKLHDYTVKVGYFDHERPSALCIIINHKNDLDLFFEVYPEGEAPAVEKPKLTPEDIAEIRGQIKTTMAEAAASVKATAPAPAPVEYEKPKPNYRINFFGWCSEDGHDKVWGYVTVGDVGSGELYNFWGKRGKRLAFQKHDGRWGSDELQKRADQKVRSGRSSGQYRQVAVVNIENVVPGFFEEFEKQLTLAKLFDNFRNKAEEIA